jgi:hypothetical protein
MKRKPRFFIGFLAAAITFGTLMATIGPRHYKHHSHHCGDHQWNEKETQNKQDKNDSTKEY